MFLDDLEYKNEKINLSISKVEVTEGLGIPYPFYFLMYRIILSFLIEDVW